MVSQNNPHDRQAKQLHLFEPDADAEAGCRPPENGASGFGDPAFASNKALPIHRWVPWIAGFSSAFVRDAIHTYLDSGRTVLDPFAGVGTTLVDAVLLGQRAIGFEINPYAAFACRVKVNAHQIDVHDLYQEIARLRTFYQNSVLSGYVPRSTPPRGFKTRTPFYSPQVLRKVLILQDFFERIYDPDLQELFKLAFASTMIRYSNYSYEPSLGRRVSAGKEEIEDYPVGETVLSKLVEMAEVPHWSLSAIAFCRVSRYQRTSTWAE